MRYGREVVELLAHAAWQVLDDMGERGCCCCPFAKAQLRIAFEPFVCDVRELEGWMSLEEAERVLREGDV